MRDIETFYLCYLSLFFHKNYKDDELLERYELSEEDAYAYLYEFFTTYLNIPLDLTDKDSKELLYNYANNMFRYKLLNDNIECVLEDFNKHEISDYIKDNLDLIIEVLEDDFDKIATFKEYEERKLAPLSNTDLDKYFKEFLNTIDKSGEYNQIYEHLKEKDILYLDYYDREQKEKLYSLLGVQKDIDYFDNFFNRINDKGIIVVNRKGNIDDMRNLTHEFAHYITFYYNKYDLISNAMLEFPPMFYENLAMEFLKTKGYTDEDIEDSNHNRFKYIYDRSSKIANINHYIRMYKEHGQITHDIDIEYRTGQILRFKEKIGKEAFLKLVKESKYQISPDSFASEFCDYANECLSINSDILTNAYPYLIGHYLSNKYLEEYKENPDDILDEMKYITVNFPNISYDKILYKDNNKTNKKDK